MVGKIPCARLGHFVWGNSFGEEALGDVVAQKGRGT